MPRPATSIMDVFVALDDPRQTNKVQHSLVETLTVAVCGILVGADTLEGSRRGLRRSCSGFVATWRCPTVFLRMTPSPGSSR